jgi:hypothetical protein
MPHTRPIRRMFPSVCIGFSLADTAALPAHTFITSSLSARSTSFINSPTS